MSPDMEDLMRKAAEAYPLKEMDDLWNEIVSKIDAAPAPLPPAKKQTGYRRYFIILLLLLLFLFTGDYLINHTGRQSVNTNKIVDDANKDTGIKQKTQSPVTPIQKTNTQTNEDGIETNDNHLMNSTPVYKTPVFGPLHFSEDRNDVAMNLVNEETTFNSSTDKLRRIQHEILIDKTIYPRPNNFSFELRNQPFFLSQDSKQKNSNSISRKRFYYGIAAGLSFNSVKEQNLKTGWDLGLLLVYYVSNRFFLEICIIISQKQYSTSGDYFSMEKVGAAMPPPMKIMEVDGNSKVIEIPLHIRYDIFQNRKRNIFSSSGFSSYILAKEYNQYHTSTNGTMQMMYGTYKRNEQYFAASLDLGIGYEQNLGRNKSIRFQPYIQIPVKGIGMGDLPVMSTGLRIALTKRAN